MAPSPNSSSRQRRGRSRSSSVDGGGGGGTAEQPRVPPTERQWEEESTQTDADTSFGSSEAAWSTGPTATAAAAGTSEVSSGESDESVMERLSRRVGSLWSGAAAAEDGRHRQDRGTQTAKDPLACETERLAFDIVFFCLGRPRPAAAAAEDEEVAQCLRRSVGKMLEKHAIVFNGMMSRLRITPECDVRRGFFELAEELFQRDEVSWAKIVALFAFGARLAQHCHEHDMSALVYAIATNLSAFAVEKLLPFLKAQGGWTTLLEAFPPEHDYESKIWRSLLLTGIGLTAVATVLKLHN